MSERLTRVTGPVLLVHGDVDRGSTTSPEQAEAMKQACAGDLTVVHIRDAGHNVRRDQREAFRQAVNEFLTSL